MRVTNQMLSHSVVLNLRRNSEALMKAQEQVSSGKKFAHASDDPAAAATVMSISVEASQNEQYLRNLKEASSWLTDSEAALDDLTNVLDRARELALETGTDTVSGDDRRNAASEIEELLEHAVQVANTKHEGQYVFAGTESDAEAFTLGGGSPPSSVTYNGNSGEIVRSIGSGVTMTINSHGGTSFQAVFNALIGMRDDLNAGSSPEARIDDIDDGLEALTTMTTQVGARMNRVEMTSSRLESVKQNLKGLRSDVEGAEIDEAAIELMSRQTTYEASLAAGAKLMQSSLLDYLR
jgi:flagellar hook-associated protein 3 FlgL